LRNAATASLATAKPKSHWRHSAERRRRERAERTTSREIPPLRGGGKSAAAVVALEGRTNKKASRCEGPKDRTEPTTALDRATEERTQPQGATTAVATLDWPTTGRRPKAPNRSECSRSPVCASGKEDLWTDQPPEAENRTSGGVGGCRGAIPGTRPDLPGIRVASCSLVVSLGIL
jgi:hypothetical protein